MSYFINFQKDDSFMLRIDDKKLSKLKVKTPRSKVNNA